jgi:hypothetical protein
MSLDEMPHSILPTVKASEVILCTNISPTLKIILATIYVLVALRQISENQILPRPQAIEHDTQRRQNDTRRDVFRQNATQPKREIL